MPQWYNAFYDVVTRLPSVKAINKRNTSLGQVIKANINPSYDYNALTKGIPQIQSGNYSLVPELNLISDDKDNAYSNYLLKVSLKIFKGNGFKSMPIKTYDLPIKYKIKSHFQFIRNISTLNIDLIDKDVTQHFDFIAQNFLKELNCRPLEGKLIYTNGELHVDIGKKQGLKVKQIGWVKGLNIKNSMISNSSVVVHTNKIYENYSVLEPLNDKIKLNTLDNLIVEFVE